MSDQDFFFEDEDEVKDEKASKSKSSKGGSKSSSSKKPASASDQNGGSKKEMGSKASSLVGTNGVAVPVVALLTIVALLVGVIGGFLIAPKNSADVNTAPTQSSTEGGSGMGGTGDAPSLTQDQVEGGAMPEGHPDIDGSSSEASAATE